MRATPVPAWVVIAGRTLTSVAISVVMVVVVCLFGAVLYGVELPTSTLPGVVVSVLVGTFSLAALGFAVAALVPSENAAPPVANVIVLPLEFISGIFVPSEQIPDWMNSIASVFPVKPLFDSLLAAFDPADDGDRRRLGRARGRRRWGVAGASRRCGCSAGRPAAEL